MASGPADYNEDDFEEYNPHPYLGGYDIALTYGSPLPPAPAICYPVSSPTPDLPPPPLAEEAKTDPTPRSQPLPQAAPIPVPEPEPERPPPYDYGTQGSYQPEPYYPDIFRSWLFGEEGRWNPWGRTLDYLFGHAQGYGERRIGVDSYGIPIYANKNQSSQSISVQVEPAPAQRLDFYDVHNEQTDESWSSSYGERREESYDYLNPTYAYDRHYYEQPLSIQVSPSEHKVFEEQVYHDQHSSSYDERNYVTDLFGSLSYGYERHYHEQPLNVQIEPIEQTWSQKLSYHDDYQRPASPKSNWHSSSSNERGGEGHIFGDPNYAYGRHSNEQTHGDQLEPFMPSWSRNLGYHEFYGEEVSHRSSWGHEDNIVRSSNHAYERHYHEDPLCLQLEPFKPAWSQNPSYYKAYEEEVPPLSNWKIAVQ
ncbi:uncharacterized protein At5g39570-like isoform X2 [Phoenix dactylifera]|uniref:Uncharacterized protein At5g39570-like isoform X2 n=1 Tax=Phoenix dactylifera TaxID=42345 RepID=A0A8B9A3X7_PHODC|nr:uncharacterized protein At5g39570-like isoform X2 [Phoenix dactylifera]